MSLMEKLASTAFAPFRRSELLSNTIEDAELLASFAKSITEAARRGEVYPARAYTVEARKVLLDLLQTTGEVQELEGAMLQRADADEKGGGDE